ncbi:hypothetical protein OG730_42230 (plasmid) [Streptomyces sp. NBC_01298]|uniref:hypothetical protein n=1 Tax=Streptomyces sp. NBC_01298 TaxID=2903817 RepID=UPI002E12F6A5|nr:hypothetical protein OG730_42230 [Streptomyces sp. NBC_01298]
MSNDPPGALEGARHLLEAEADRRGISVEALVDQLAREGRRTGLTAPAPQDDFSRWTTPPPWARVVSMVGWRGTPKTAAEEPAEAFDHESVLFGTINSGKTSIATLTRARLEMEGIPFDETVCTTDSGDRYIEFRIQRPDHGKE